MDGGSAMRVLGDKYQLLHQLSRGGMGAVWYARHLVLDSPVAVKLLDVGADDEAALARFLLEAKTAAALRSPHIVQILDYGVELDTPYIVMELLEGESLAERLARVHRLTAAETDGVLVQIARAVSRAHEAGIVHRDLKPANVFLVKNADSELVKLLDFGIVKAPRAQDRETTKSGTFLGTPLYASPEQTQGQRVDARTDVWGLGVIAFECLTGLRPFGGETFGAIVLSICTKPLPKPSVLAEVPAGFDEWFARACARDREHRFESARSAAEALSLVCRGAPVARLASASAPSRSEVAASPALAATTPEHGTEVMSLALVGERGAREPLSSGRRWRWGAALLAVAALTALALRQAVRQEPAAAARPAAAAGAAATPDGAAPRPAPVDTSAALLVPPPSPAPSAEPTATATPALRPASPSAVSPSPVSPSPVSPSPVSPSPVPSSPVPPPAAAPAERASKPAAERPVRARSAKKPPAGAPPTTDIDLGL